MLHIGDQGTSYPNHDDSRSLFSLSKESASGDFLLSLLSLGFVHFVITAPPCAWRKGSLELSIGSLS